MSIGWTSARTNRDAARCDGYGPREVVATVSVMARLACSTPFLQRGRPVEGHYQPSASVITPWSNILLQRGRPAEGRCHRRQRHRQVPPRGAATGTTCWRSLPHAAAGALEDAGDRAATGTTCWRSLPPGVAFGLYVILGKLQRGRPAGGRCHLPHAYWVSGDTGLLQRGRPAGGRCHHRDVPQQPGDAAGAATGTTCWRSLPLADGPAGQRAAGGCNGDDLLEVVATRHVVCVADVPADAATGTTCWRSLPPPISSTEDAR